MMQKFTYRNPKILAHANGQPCHNCGCQDGTIVAAHSNQIIHGKARGIKAHDCYVAFLCHRCHDWLDGRTNAAFDPSGRWDGRTERKDMFSLAMHKTWLTLLRDGVLK